MKKLSHSLSSSYLAEKATHEEELRKMQGKYTEEYITESRQNWKPKTDYRKAVSIAREKHQKLRLHILTGFKRKWTNIFKFP